jgi:hypothetical protein
VRGCAIPHFAQVSWPVASASGCMEHFPVPWMDITRGAFAKKHFSLLIMLRQNGKTR